MDNPFFLALGLIVSVFFGIILPLWILSVLRGILRELRKANKDRATESRFLAAKIAELTNALTTAE